MRGYHVGQHRCMASIFASNLDLTCSNTQTAPSPYSLKSPLTPSPWRPERPSSHRGPAALCSSALPGPISLHCPLYTLLQSNDADANAASEERTGLRPFQPVRFILLNALLPYPCHLAPASSSFRFQLRDHFLFSNPFPLQDTSSCEGSNRVTLIPPAFLKMPGTL